MSQKSLPEVLKGLHVDPEKAFNMDQLNYLLYQPANNAWVKQHPTATVKDDKGANVKAKYVPIDKVEFMLSYIFQEWRLEVLREGVMFNSIYVTVRLHYKNPVTNEWSFHDGVGAKDLQLDAGSVPSDLTKLKASAVMMALPSAVSYALKDAAEHLGPIFGRDLNRKDNILFTGVYGVDQQPPPQQPVQQVQQPVQQTTQPAQNVNFVM